MGKLGHFPKKYGLFLGICILVGCIFIASIVFASDVTNIENLVISKFYRQVDLSWSYDSTDTTATQVFAVYRADDASGTNAHRLATLSNTSYSYSDLSLIPGATYCYAVVFGQTRDDVESLNTASLIWSSPQKVPSIGGTDEEGAQRLTPHRGDTYNANLNNKSCARCHGTHDVSGSSEKLLITSQDSTEPNPKIAICEGCHLSNTSVEKPFVQTILSATSGHTIKSSQNSNGTLACLTCHGAHQDSSKGTGALTPKYFYKFGSLTSDINIGSTDRLTTCTPCHDDAQTWYTATHDGAYPTSESRESTLPISSGYKTYPTSGSYPGATTYQSSAKNGHMGIAAQDTYSAGDCRYCHSAHGSSAQYDGLLAERGELRAMKATSGVVSDEEKTSGAYASFCLSCHNGSTEGTPWAGAADIADIVSLPAGSSEESSTAFLASAAGHRVSSVNADVPAGSSLPCYICHNPHGSKNGNAYNLNDSLGSNLSGDRNTCFACHATSDGYVLGADGTSYVTVSASTPKVVGLDRSGSDTVNGEQVTNKLKLPDLVEAHSKDSDMPCLGCHKDVHAPAEGGGTGDADGKSCLQCHNANEFPEALKYEFTASGSGEAEEWENGYNPHLIPFFSHSMGVDFFPELILQSATQAIIPLSLKNPASTQSLPEAVPYEPEVRQAAPLNTSRSVDTHVGPYCAGCHAWHTAEVTGANGSGQDFPGGEEPTPGKNTGATLRLNYNSTHTSTTDYVHTPGSPKLGGLCLSCHNDYLGDSSVGAPSKGPLNDLNKLDSELFNNCFHNYTIELTRKTGAGGTEYDVTKTFNANCAKCHNDADAIANPLENRNTLDLKVHYVPGRRLLARFGIVADISSHAIGSTDSETNRLNYNNRGMCFGCHARKGEIAGNAGKNYAGKDWYGQKQMNSAPTTTYQQQGWVYDSTLGLAKREFKNAAGQVIGTLTMNNEATFDDMYKLSTQTNGFPSGDGTGGVADAAANTALTNGLEVVGHQPNIPKSQWNTETLKPYVINNPKIQAIRCSDCHNVHATATGAMGTHVEWPLTQKKLVGATGGMQGYNGNAIYADTVTPSSAIAADGNRPITLNDFWSRNNLVDDVKSAIIAWLQTSAGGSYSAAAAQTKYEEMDYNGISAQDVATATGTTVSQGLALEWSRSVDIFCFRCHEESSLTGKAHNPGAGSHRTKALACIECHVPTVHGGKMAGLIGDRDSIPGIDGRAAGAVASGHVAMQPHQIFRWANISHQSTSSQTIAASDMNVPILHIKSITPGAYSNRNSCMSLKSGGGCHTQGRGGGTQHWNTAD